MGRTEKYTTVACWVIMGLAAALIGYAAVRILHGNWWGVALAGGLSAVAVVCTYLGFRSLRRNDTPMLPSLSPKSAGDIGALVTMLATACEDAPTYERLERLLSMPDAKRQAFVRNWVGDLLIAEAPRDFTQAIACLLDDRIC